MTDKKALKEYIKQLRVIAQNSPQVLKDTLLREIDKLEQYIVW